MVQLVLNLGELRFQFFVLDLEFVLLNLDFLRQNHNCRFKAVVFHQDVRGIALFRLVLLACTVYYYLLSGRGR